MSKHCQINVWNEHGWELHEGMLRDIMTRLMHGVLSALTEKNMDEAANLLHWQNEKSLKDRYKHWYSDEPRRAFKIVDSSPEPVAILKLCESYEANSGTTDYPMSIAAAIIKAIRSRAIKGLAGYDEARWVIE